MNKIWKYLVVATAAISMAACNDDIDDLKKDIDNIYSRLEAIETQIDLLNSNVAALQTLMKGATINSVSESGGTYTLTLSNGEVLTLTQGSEGGYLTPIMSVDKDGYWIVSTDGTTFSRVLDNGKNPVKAIATDGTQGATGTAGVTPQFKVDAEGYWMASYDNGKTFSKVLDTNNKPVNATQGTAQDKFFADIKVDNDMLVVSLLTGETVKAPIVAGFKCIIANTESVVYFAQRETKTFDVDMAGVAQTIVAAPEGWSAALTAKADNTGYTLTVSAPEEQTKAIADSRIDVSILAIAKNGLSTISKMQVALTSMVLHTPVATAVNFDAAQTTENTLTFTVATSDANGWKYVCLPSSEAAPTAEYVFENGTVGSTEGATTASGLVQGTFYTVYAVAYYDNTAGTTLAQAEARTAKGNIDYYEAGVTINGVTYDKNSADAQLVTASTEINKNGVYFLDPQAGAEITLTQVTATNLVIIGRYSLTPVDITWKSGHITIGNGNGFIMKNVVLGTVNDYLFNFASGAVAAENFIIDESKIIMNGGKNMSYFNNASATIKNILIKDSKIEFKATNNGTASRIINFNVGACVAENGSIVFDNTAIYSDNYVIHGTLVHINKAEALMPTVTIDVHNCSLVNFIGYPNGHFIISDVKSVNFNKNIIWSTNYVQASYTFKFLIASPATTLDYKDNLVYGLAENNAGSYKLFQGQSLYIPDTGSYQKESSNPFDSMDFATGKFVSSDTAYGAFLE